MSPREWWVWCCVAAFFCISNPIATLAAAAAGHRHHPERPRVSFPCEPPRHSAYPFCNTSLPVPERARSLVAHLTLHEKVQQLSNGAAPVPRLGLPAYEWWSESLHGVAANGPGVNFDYGPVHAATVFPQVILTAASFNRTLWSLVARAVAVEARSMYNVGQAGLTFWAPNINIFRDPRWGRGQETSGEDPMVASAYAVEYVRGFQGRLEEHSSSSSPPSRRRRRPPPHDRKRGGYGDGDGGGTIAKKRALRVSSNGGYGGGGGGGDSSSLMLSACCKHYTAYDLEAWGNFSRYSFNAQVTPQDMGDTYQPPFRSCVREGRATCLMCSYNEVNGVPSCARHDLLEEARTDWGLQGYITSDCNAIATIYEYQGYVQSPEDAVADALKAGVDINCGGYYLEYTESAIRLGKVKEEVVDGALFNLFSVQLRLGLFDGDPSKRQFGELGPSDVCTAEHWELALEAARQGIVLLKNDKEFLPLRKAEMASLAVIGPAAKNKSSTVLGGDYAGIPCNAKSLFEGLQPHVRLTSFATGCPDVPCNSEEGFDEAVRVAGEAEAVVVVAGLDLTQENEDHDRVSLLLPGKQAGLVTAVARASKNPIVLILMGGGPMDVSFAKENPRIASILWVGYPGEAGGQAVAEVIFGEFNPGGRLPVTWYPQSFATDVPMNDMNMRPNHSRGYPGRTYRFYTGEVVYGFGHGLSYSNYSCKFSTMVPDKISLLAAAAAAAAHNSTTTTSRNLLAKEDQRDVEVDGLDYVGVDKRLLECCEASKFYVRISVVNNGAMDGSHIILLFSRSPSGKNMRGAPQRQLIGFERVHTTTQIRATEASILVDPCEHLSTVNEHGERILPLGTHTLMLEDEEHPIIILSVVG